MSIVKIQPYIIDETKDFTFANVSVTSNVTAGNANLGNAATANFFIGSGNNLSNLQVANVTGLGNIATLNIDGNASNILYGNGVFSSAPVTYGNSNVASFLANYGSNTITTTGNVTVGNIIGNGQALTGINGANVTGQVGNAAIAGTVYTNAQPNITSLGTLSSLSVTGNSNVGNVNASIISASGNLTVLNANLGNAATANFFIGSGNNLSNIQGSNVTGAVANANYAAYAGNVTIAGQSNITSVGTLTSLSVSGTSNIVDLNATGNVLISGNLTVNGTTEYINVTNLAVKDPIISIGRGDNNAPLTTDDGKDRGEQLWYYSVSEKSGFIGFDNSAGKLIAATDVSITNEIVTVNSYGNFVVGNLEGSTISISGNISAANFTTGNIVTAGNINFTGANAYFSNISNIHIPGGTANYVISTDGNGNLSWQAGGGAPGGSNTQMQFNDSNVFGGAANVIYNKTSNTLSVTGNAVYSGANVSLGDVANLHISGGSNGKLLSTDGSGNLSFIDQAIPQIYVDTFTGNGVETNYTLSTTPSNVDATTVNYNGATLLKSSYSIAGSVLTFSSPPANSSLIEVTSTVTTSVSFAGGGVRTYTGDGSNVNYTVTLGTSSTSVLVTLDGVVQTPTTDYSIAGSTLTFSTAPDNGVAILIRETAVLQPVSAISTGKSIAMAMIFGF